MDVEHVRDDGYNKRFGQEKGFMQVKFGAQEWPSRVVVEKQTATPTYAKFIIEPFERSFGHSIGNALRRVVLSSLETPGIISFRMEGIPHEFMSVPGIVEDVAIIILNLKGALLRRLPSEESGVSRDVRFVSSTIDITREQLDKNNGSIVVTLGDVLGKSPFELVNPELALFTVTAPMKRQIDLRIGFGKGYVPSERHILPSKMEGEIVIDTAFSPIVLANYFVENTRVGQDTDYDRLVLEIATDGRLTPVEALSFAAQILTRNLEVFHQVQDHHLVFEQRTEDSSDDDKLLDKLVLGINEIELSVRATNCLTTANIRTIAELVCIPEKTLLQYRNFGKKSLSEIKAKLMDMGLMLGMDLTRFKISCENVKERIQEIVEERRSKKEKK
jgi:DNA-directed RNA polymerase subunit alpha